jgi:hypothetical protein
VNRPERAALLEAMENLSGTHREHEKFYSVAPLEDAVRLHRNARTLHALADRWSGLEPASSTAALSPFEGATDLNDPTATQLDGVLFMEGQAEPAEIAQMKRDLRATAERALAGGEWLATAMASTWAFAEATLDIGELADQLGERHRIIANDWQAASATTLAGRVLLRAVEMLDRVDFSPVALRADLAGDRVAPTRCSSAAELIGYAADLFCDAARLVHDNERRWRVFRARVRQVLDVSQSEIGERDDHIDGTPS